ncbi:MAG: fructosamine kinase family protein [Chitinophagaceae bacterium]
MSEKVQSKLNSLQVLPVGGGSINECYRLTIDDNRSFFLKLNIAKKFPGLFEKETNGLNFLASQKIIKCPEVFFISTINDQQLLILEWIDTGIKTNSFWKIFGEKLAQLHQVTNTDFGFAEDNYMGALPQHNAFTTSWIEFFTNQRLRPQTELAMRKNLLDKQHLARFERLYANLQDIFEEENPSLLHGDLWSGNFLCDEKSGPVLIDPAVYFGNRNIDLAMTTLFGGFDKAFYDSYHYHFPFPKNYQDQWSICNLYPLLIHLNLFGSGYLYDIETVLKKFTA